MPQRGRSRRAAARQTQLSQRKKRVPRGPSENPSTTQPPQVREAADEARPTVESRPQAPAVAQRPSSGRHAEPRPTVYNYVRPEIRRIMVLSTVIHSYPRRTQLCTEVAFFMEREEFAHRLRIAPDKPGIYMMKDARDKVLYVGKASSLRNRTRSYFGSPHNLAPKIRKMVSRVVDFEFIVTDSEAEAIILECTLIKKFRPTYNARLKDDKSYPYIKIDLTEDFPQVYITRRVVQDGARYFGPFATAGSIRRTLDTLKKLFPYRSCTKVITGRDPRPCLEYYINRCVAPCIGAVNREEYHKVIQQIIMFMEGKTERVVDDLQQRMEEAAEKLEYEQAAALRDQIRSIQKVIEEQRIKVASNANRDMDAIAMAEGQDEAWVEVFFIRQGKLIGRDHFIMEGTQDDPPGHILAEFIKQFYQSASSVPRRIILQYPPEEEKLIQEWLKVKRGAPVTLARPLRGEQHKLIRMVAENAAQGLSQTRAKWLSNADAVQQAMLELQEELNLPRSPSRIECYDISNIQGTNAVGSMVTFQEGFPKPAHYRRFRIKTVEGVDDYAMMQEMLRRRFSRLAALKGKGSRGKSNGHPGEGAHSPSEQNWGIVPDLVLIDGGKGHLSAALEVFLETGHRLHSLGLHSQGKGMVVCAPDPGAHRSPS